jgi:hypothetical protein
MHYAASYAVCMASLSRVTISVPPGVARDLKRAAKLLGLSQSAVVATLIASDVRELAKSNPGVGIPRSGSSGKRRRLRPASAVIVRATVEEALEAAANKTAELPFGPVR